MSPKSFFLSSEIHEYLLAHGQPPDAIQQSLIDATVELGSVAGMQIAPEQGALMTMLTQIVGARNAVEVGTFTGYATGRRPAWPTASTS
jgi:caffeoyl-CoA O-methyltransferase